MKSERGLGSPQPREVMGSVTSYWVLCAVSHRDQMRVWSLFFVALEAFIRWLRVEI